MSPVDTPRRRPPRPGVTPSLSTRVDRCPLSHMPPTGVHRVHHMWTLVVHYMRIPGEVPHVMVYEVPPVMVYHDNPVGMSPSTCLVLRAARGHVRRIGGMSHPVSLMRVNTPRSRCPSLRVREVCALLPWNADVVVPIIPTGYTQQDGVTSIVIAVSVQQ